MDKLISIAAAATGAGGQNEMFNLAPKLDERNLSRRILIWCEPSC
jgi:hypothetical protein